MAAELAQKDLGEILCQERTPALSFQKSVSAAFSNFLLKVKKVDGYHPHLLWLEFEAISFLLLQPLGRLSAMPKGPWPRLLKSCRWAGLQSKAICLLRHQEGLEANLEGRETSLASWTVLSPHPALLEAHLVERVKMLFLAGQGGSLERTWATTGARVVLARHYHPGSAEVFSFHCCDCSGCS